MTCRKNHRWTKDDIKFLQENYTTLGPDGCAAALEAPRPSVLYHARRNGLTRSYSFWSDADIKYLIDNYGKMSYRELTAHLGRTKHSINGKLSKLTDNKGAKVRTGKRPWTKNDVKKLKQLHKKKLSDTKIAKELHRSPQTIKKKRLELNLTENFPYGKPWTESDTRYLMQHYVKDGAATCAAHLDRTKDAVHQQVARLKQRGLMPQHGQNEK